MDSPIDDSKIIDSFERIERQLGDFIEDSTANLYRISKEIAALSNGIDIDDMRLNYLNGFQSKHHEMITVLNSMRLESIKKIEVHRKRINQPHTKMSEDEKKIENRILSRDTMESNIAAGRYLLKAIESVGKPYKQRNRADWQKEESYSVRELKEELAGFTGPWGPP